ncbi:MULTISPECIES: helix-turn-helix domain-containing protein [Clostridium]|jgi:excisionase family DNA binding protein|uniref:Helix-turn-helix domain protein n=3 Tax=Clostridium TaxID=1485 RepID=A0A162JCZ5_9CLOT|nr:MULTISPECIES: helix-turn-helix domain-containing protein [Clostridium]AGY75887.1 helix-turn-helix domain-containing protein [Clostridium autoethanogenum DSM 10061]ALU36053.1 DNA-binding protein [Clostridium autoethanogenum DSM 10061]OAA93535.1 Helix-turn-helix domain protein [Clostridium coskatii]OBR90018.1 helix-turn-helix domain protein [Clostridium ragsdalei P11]OBR96324.1 helix-turn-helix domain protein [Clostridium coskatii]
MIKERLNELPPLITVKEMAQVLRIERSTANEIIYRENFTIIMLKSRRTRIIKEELINWLENNTAKYKFNG